MNNSRLPKAPNSSRPQTADHQSPERDAAAALFNPFRPHPWHGLSSGDDIPNVVNAFIEITPFDLVKYEVDKVSGYLRVDRPQRTSSQPPALYGFIPRTLCADHVRKLSPETSRGDGDPLDICVISERPITKSEVIVRARPIGGLQMIDADEADDKIIAVLHNDHVWGRVRELHDLPSVLLERLRHYFETYKIIPGAKTSVRIRRPYGRVHAGKVIAGAIQDYDALFGSYENRYLPPAAPALDADAAPSPTNHPQAPTAHRSHAQNRTERST